MPELWLVKDDYRIIFDTKEQTEALGLEMLPSASVVELTEKEFEEYQFAVESFHYWQRKLRNLLPSQK